MKELENNDDNDINKRNQIIARKERNIFFYDIFNEWNNLIQELYDYSQSQLQLAQMESLPEELSNKINYIRLFIRAVLPANNSVILFLIIIIIIN